MTRSRWFLLVAAIASGIAVYLPWSWGPGSNFAMGLSLTVRWLGIAYLGASGLILLSLIGSYLLPPLITIWRGLQVFLGFWMTVFSLSLTVVGLSFTGRSSLAFLGQTLTLGPGMYLLLLSSLLCLLVPIIGDRIDDQEGE